MIPTRPSPERLREPLPAGRPAAAAVGDLGARLAPAAVFLVLLAGITGVVSGVLPPEHRRLAVVVRLLGLPAASAAATASIVLGTVLVLLARGLRRRQRRAWVLAVPLLAAGAVSHIVKGLDVEEASVCLLALAVLVAARREFRARPAPDERAHPLLLAAGLAVFAVAVGLTLLTVSDGAVAGSPSLRDRLLEVLAGLVGMRGPLTLVGEGGSDLLTTVAALGLLTLAVPIVAALRTPPGAAGLGPDQEVEVRALLAARCDGDSLGYFALRTDKELVFSPSRKAAVSFRVQSGVALASGDPLGDPEAWPGALTAFLTLADVSGWVPAVLGCSVRGGTAWSRAGLTALEIGDEAIVTPETFTLEGRAARGVRQAVNRLRRAGFATDVRRVGELSAAELAELQAAADRWRDGPVERGFSMALSRIGAAGDESCVVATCTRDGQLQGLLHFVPWGEDGLSLDLMRRARGTDNGVNELLITAAVAAAPELGVRRVSLNFAVFRGALEQGARLGAGPVVRAWRSLLLLASRFWQIDSLYRFNDKFRPEWQPRYVCYRRASDLPRVLIASLQAEAFLPRAVLPRLGLPRLRRQGLGRGPEGAAAGRPREVSSAGRPCDEALPCKEALPRDDALPRGRAAWD